MLKKLTPEEIAFRDAAAIAAMSQLLNQDAFCVQARTAAMQDVILMSLASTAFRTAEAMVWARKQDFSKAKEKN